MRREIEKMLAMGPFASVLCAESTQYDSFFLNKVSMCLIQHVSHNCGAIQKCSRTHSPCLTETFIY